MVPLTLITMLYTTHSRCITEILYPLTNISFPPPILLAPGNQPSSFYEFDYIGTSCKWIRTVFSFLWLAHFTYSHILKFHPCCGMCWNFLTFKIWIIYQCVCVFVCVCVYTQNIWGNENLFVMCEYNVMEKRMYTYKFKDILNWMSFLKEDVIDSL